MSSAETILLAQRSRSQSALKLFIGTLSRMVDFQNNLQDDLLPTKTMSLALKVKATVLCFPLLLLKGHS